MITVIVRDFWDNAIVDVQQFDCWEAADAFQDETRAEGLIVEVQL